MFNRVKDGMYWDRAWKLVEGCTPVSEGCAHCWSARETHMRAKHPNDKIASRNEGLTNATGTFNGGIRLRVDNLGLPLRVKKPTVFAVWNDLFHEDVPFEFITTAWLAMLEGHARFGHIFMVLTKRPERALLWWKSTGWQAAQPGVWLGVTAENQGQADKRILVLLQIPAEKWYVSIEPMLDMVCLMDFQFRNWLSVSPTEGRFGCDGRYRMPDRPIIDWVICGGESGPGARPMHPAWVRDLQAQCSTSHAPFFFKQWGGWSPDNVPGYDTAVESGMDGVDPYVMVRVGKTTAGRILDGKEYLEVPQI